MQHWQNIGCLMEKMWCRHNGRLCISYRHFSLKVHTYMLKILTLLFCIPIRAKPLSKMWAAGLDKTRKSSEDEIANVNFLYDDIVHALQNTIDTCINSTRDRCGYVLERRFTKFSEITHSNSLYAIQDNSRSPILVPLESSYDFL